MFQCFETPDMGPGIFTFFLFQFVSKRFEKIETVDLDILSLFQYVSVSLLYNLYVSMFQNTRYGAWNFTFLCFSLFRNISKQLKVWVDLEIFCLFHFVSVVLLYKSICFNVSKTPDMGAGIFTFFLFQFVSKRFENN